MFDVKLPGNHNLAHCGDERLKEALRQWRDIEPRAGFESRVWRRIHSWRPSVRATTPIMAFVNELLHQASWGSALAASVAIIFGAWAGSASLSSPHRHRSAEVLLHSQTLAGAYAELVKGGSR